jgi:tetratricopeptide (TPR) repeat protein
MKAKDPSELDRLRTRIKEALARERPRGEIIPLLSALLEAAGEQRDVYVFAHRHLAELSLQEQPWQAALHLRRVIRAGAADDTVHALMGLCQALLGNFESAVHHYERALGLEPSNAWYHHNLGHLLDVALGRPDAALLHLRWAHESHPVEDEVTASLAHCLARMGQLAEAEDLAREAVDLAPEHDSHASLLSWIRRGAPGGYLFSASQSFQGTARKRKEARERGAARDAVSGEGVDGDVLRALSSGMASTGAPDTLIGRAERLWRDYRARRPDVRVSKPEVHAAALEYAVSVLHGLAGVTQSGVAKRYGVSSTAVSSRYTDIRVTLALTVGDPRYLG